MRISIPTIFTLIVSLLPGAADASTGGVQRYALVAGANYGGPDRAQLRYAISDAERFAGVLSALGGVDADNTVVLRQPGLKELTDALEAVRGRVVQARSTTGGRTELIVYYSGHADEQGLLLGEDRYSYRSLRDRLDEIPADVRIAVLDACGSGAITRLKGGTLRPPFLVDEAADMRGHAFLTSSAESEAAQESDRIGASYFTHYLVSGLRGAADTSGEGKVTLNEAYQFAFNETLGRTLETQGGAQHPSYDINLSGTGDVVMTDLRQTTATLILGEELDGRFYVENENRELVVELQKPYGRRVELGLEPGKYQIIVERDETAIQATSELAEGEQFVLEPAQFGPAELERTRARGKVRMPTFAVSNRNRFELRFGMWGGGESVVRTGVLNGASNTDLLAGLRYTRYLRENVAFTLTADVLPAEAGSRVGPDGVFNGAETVVSVPLGLRWNPLGGVHHEQSAKPFLAASVGPVFGTIAGSGVGSSGVFNGARSSTVIGGSVGGGVDVHLGRNWSIGVDAGYTWMGDFSEPIAGRDNYSGFNLAVGFGFLFGRGSDPIE